MCTIQHITCLKLEIYQIEIKQVKNFNFLGTVIDKQLNWNSW